VYVYVLFLDDMLLVCAESRKKKKKKIKEKPKKKKTQKISAVKILHVFFFFGVRRSNLSLVLG